MNYYHLICLSGPPGRRRHGAGPAPPGPSMARAHLTYYQPAKARAVPFSRRAGAPHGPRLPPGRERAIRERQVIAGLRAVQLPMVKAYWLRLHDPVPAPHARYDYSANPPGISPYPPHRPRQALPSALRPYSSPDIHLSLSSSAPTRI